MMWLSLFPPTSQMLNEGLFLMQLSKAMLLQGVPKKKQIWTVLKSIVTQQYNGVSISIPSYNTTLQIFSCI